MSRTATYFISDLHLGAAYLENPLDYERRVVRWLHSVKDTACEIYLLGDVLDYWYEYRNVVPRGFTRFLGTLALLADSGVKITWLIGNHDIWIFDYLPSEIGCEVIDGSCVREISGKRFYMEHGDAVGKLKPMFKMMRSAFRNRVCQKLFAAIHPRWTVPFANNWSSHSRKAGGYQPRFDGEDKEPFIEFARSYNQAAEDKVDFFIFGHRHIMLDYKMENDARVIVLGDWVNHFSYAVFDEGKLSLKQFEEAIRIY